MRSLVRYLMEMLVVTFQGAFIVTIGVIVFTITIAISAALLCFILKNAFE